MPNNILITPGSASIQFSGSAANTIRLQVENSGSIAFYGNSGSLFGISDSLSGSLMSVNDVSGLPILEVFSDDRIIMGSFNKNTLVVTGSRIGIDKAIPTTDLDISGSVFITGSLRMSLGSITGSLFGTSSVATSASFATTSSYALSSSFAPTILPSGVVSSSTQINTGSFSGSITTASFSTTASYALSSSYAPLILPSDVVSSSLQINTGSFTGSFTGTLDAVSVSASIISASTSLQTGNIFSSGSIRHTGSLILSSSTVNVSGSMFMMSPTKTSTAATFNVPNIISNPNAQSVDGVVIDNSSLYVRGRVVVQERYYSPASLTTSPGKITLSTYNQSTAGGTSRITLTSPIGTDIGVITTKDAPASSTDNFLRIGTLNATPLYFGTQNSESMWQLGTNATLFPTAHDAYDLGSTSNRINRLVVASISASIISASSYTSSVTNAVGFFGTASRAVTASYALTSLGGGSTFPYDGQTTPALISGSLVISGSATGPALAVTGSINASGSITSSDGFFGTSSWAQSASVAISSSYVLPNGLPVGTISSSIQINTGSFTGSFIGTHTGSLFGTASVAISSSYALSASYAPVGSAGLTTKAGNIANSSFAGNPRKAAVNFSSAFSTTNYAIVITGEDARSWTVEGKVVGGFTASANSNTGLAGTTYWIATAYGET